MKQFISRPDRYVSLCGHLDCVVAETRIDGAPAFMQGVRVLFVSDVHAVARTSESDFAAFMRKVKSLAPDLLLLGGDYADDAADCERFFAAFDSWKPPLGMYAVVGNNDREAWPDVEALRTVMASAGCTLLLNASRTVEVNGGRLIIAGVDELKYGEPDFANLFPASASEDRYRILVSHFPMMPENPPELVLSGHTHGGQLNVLGITPYFIGFEGSKVYSAMRRYIAGLHREGMARILVSKGVGASRIPLRVGVQPEINLLLFTA